MRTESSSSTHTKRRTMTDESATSHKTTRSEASGISIRQINFDDFAYDFSLKLLSHHLQHVKSLLPDAKNKVVTHVVMHAKQNEDEYQKKKKKIEKLQAKPVAERNKF
ncbi:hypothetical protein RIF29_00628 [Crotalaria pallida]|uniref:Uncharacterized protein n=1 Tax=Crotalaria pallida TaxID=3830 RepID=A0AAN9IWB1_CROPI